MKTDFIRFQITRLEKRWLEAVALRESLGVVPVEMETRAQAGARIAVESAERALHVLYEALGRR